jgi:lysophospholipase L1-like esterase
MRVRAVLLSAITLMSVSACSSGVGDEDGSAQPTSTSAEATTSVPVEPTGVIALGLSNVTGLGADPDRLDASAYEYSWATGDAPEVESIYRRLVAEQLRHEGHVTNAAANGSTVSDVIGRARRALEEVPNPALVLIMSVDNDIRCDGTDADHVEAVGADLAEVLDVITEAAPEARIVIAGSPNRPATFVDALIAAGVDFQLGSGMCALITADGSPDVDALRTLTGIIEAYEAEMVRVCATYEQCTSAVAAAAAAAPIGPDSIALDRQHSSIQGHPEIAEAIWPVVAEALGLA